MRALRESPPLPGVTGVQVYTDGVPPTLDKVWSEGPDHAIGEWSNTLLTTWRTVVTIDALEVSRIASHDLHSRYPDGIVVFNVIPGVMPIPPMEVRRKASRVLGETGDHVLCTTTVIQGEGFWVSAARAAVAGITLFSRAPHPHKVFGTISDGAKWAAPNLVGDPEPNHLVTVAEQLLAHGV